MATNDKKTTSFLRRTAGEVKRYRKVRKVVPAVMGVTLALLTIVYVISLLFSKYGSFTVKITDFNDHKYSLSLAENERFSNPVSFLNAGAIKDATNIDGNSLPANLNDTNGEHNGENYVAYTFYVKNTGSLELTYNYRLEISRMTAGIDAAIRVRLYYTPFYYKAETKTFDRNGVYTDFAKAKTAGNGEPEIDPYDRVMTNFTSSGTVTEGTVDGFAPGDISKITVVIWIEGNDPDCTDDLIGGEFKVDMIMEVVGAT